METQLPEHLWFKVKFSILCFHNAVLRVWHSLGTKTHLLGLGERSCFGIPGSVAKNTAGSCHAPHQTFPVLLPLAWPEKVPVFCQKYAVLLSLTWLENVQTSHLITLLLQTQTKIIPTFRQKYLVLLPLTPLENVLMCCQKYKVLLPLAWLENVPRFCQKYPFWKMSRHFKNIHLHRACRNVKSQHFILMTGLKYGGGLVWRIDVEHFWRHNIKCAISLLFKIINPIKHWYM